MLGKNLDPVIIISLTDSKKDRLSEVSNFGDQLLGSLIPRKPYMIIPIYLSEQATGVMGMGAEKRISIKNITKNDKKYSRPTSEDLTINLQLRKGNVLGSMIASAMQMIFGLVDTESYFVTIFYDEKFMTAGTLKDFTMTPDGDTDLDNISMTFSSDPPEPKAVTIVENTKGINPIKNVLGG